MPFIVGQTVVHPFHGPLKIVEITERVLAGSPTPCFRMTAVDQELEVSVPVDRAEAAGLREISSPARVSMLLEILGREADTPQATWSRRMKNYQELVATGVIDDLCVVIRQISRDSPKAPASAEGQLLRTARSRLATELALSLRIAPEEADRIIDVALRGDVDASTLVGRPAAAA